MVIEESDTTAELREQMVALLDSLSAIRALSMLNLENQTEEQLINQAISALVTHQDVELCSIFLLFKDELHCVAGTSVKEESGLEAGHSVASPIPVASMRFRLGEGLIGLAVETHTLQYASDCSQDKRFKPFAQDDEKRRIGSVISVPMVFNGNCLGAINVSHSKPNFFQTWHQHMLKLFSSMLAQTLANHRLLNDLETVVDERTIELQNALDEARQTKHYYEKLSAIDELTGLNNRRTFFNEATSCLSRALRYQVPLSLMLIDVDHFKRINDLWGRNAGDEALCRIADMLGEAIRAGDVLARLGGEEFAIVLPNTDATGADLIAMRIQAKIAALGMGSEAASLGITVSIGIACIDDGTDSTVAANELLDIMYAKADTAIYACKKRGHNHRMLYHAEMNGSG